MHLCVAEEDVARGDHEVRRPQRARFGIEQDAAGVVAGHGAAERDADNPLEASSEAQRFARVVLFTFGSLIVRWSARVDLGVFSKVVLPALSSQCAKSCFCQCLQFALDASGSI